MFALTDSVVSARIQSTWERHAKFASLTGARKYACKVSLHTTLELSWEGAVERIPLLELRRHIPDGRCRENGDEAKGEDENLVAEKHVSERRMLNLFSISPQMRDMWFRRITLDPQEAPQDSRKI
ncbi:MAG: hypothetical protein M1839_003030 [Geoglossum umbratile]|nr:MAG: hypothetical protein M1839_003030 [Geoglossum umbratile]